MAGEEVVDGEQPPLDYFMGISGLVTKNTIDFIRENNLYND